MDIELAAVVDAENPIADDLRLTNGQITLVSGAAAVAQHLRVRLAFVLGEWFLNPDEGMPLFTVFLVAAPDLKQAYSVVRQAILGTPGIDSLVTLSLSFDSVARTIRVSFVAHLDGGHIFNSADWAPFVVGV